MNKNWSYQESTHCWLRADGTYRIVLQTIDGFRCNVCTFRLEDVVTGRHIVTCDTLPEAMKKGDQLRRK